MDRGRVGYAATGNKFIRDLMIKNRRKDHLARIKKIMKRAPGTGTVDSTAPVVVGTNTNRKEVIRREINTVIERENK